MFEFCNRSRRVKPSGVGIKEGDEIIVPVYTCAASASPAIHCGATVIFMDIQKDGGLRTRMPEMDYDMLEAAIAEKTKTIMTVDLTGIVCDYDNVFEVINRKKNLFIPLQSDGTPLGDLSSRIQNAIGSIAVVADCALSLGASRTVSFTSNGELIELIKKYCGRITLFFLYPSMQLRFSLLLRGSISIASGSRCQ